MRVPVANKNKLRGSRNAAIYGDRSDSDNEKNRSDEYDSDDALVKPLSISAKNHNKSKGKNLDCRIYMHFLTFLTMSFFYLSCTIQSL